MATKSKQPIKGTITMQGEYTNIGDNIGYRIDGDLLYLMIDISEEIKNNAPFSASGKTKTVATSHGFTRINGISLSLNVSAK